MTLTSQQQYEIYGSITGTDYKFIKQMAIAAIRSAVDVQTDMFLDSEVLVSPDDNDMRQFAYNFTADMLTEFRTLLLEEIKKVNFSANAEVVHSLKTNLEFHPQPD